MRNLKDDTKYLDVIKLAEATKIRDMMREYGAWNHTPEQYQQLMSRLNTGMSFEAPTWYDNYETIGSSMEKTSHAHAEWDILNTIINHANFKVINWRSEIFFLANNNPNKMNIIWLSKSLEANKDEYKTWWMNNLKNSFKKKNLILFWSWPNIRKKDWTLLNKICQENCELHHEHSTYTHMSAAPSKNDNSLDIHMILTIWTNKDGNIDQTNESQEESSKFPIWFHDKVLFSGRCFPYTNSN